MALNALLVGWRCDFGLCRIRGLAVTEFGESAEMGFVKLRPDRRRRNFPFVTFNFFRVIKRRLSRRSNYPASHRFRIRKELRAEK